MEGRHFLGCQGGWVVGTYTAPGGRTHRGPKEEDVKAQDAWLVKAD